jgi:hypothetical protein
MGKRPKIPDLLEVVRERATSGNYLLLEHARDRGEERGITEPEWLYVLKHGYHEKRKDQFDDFHRAWAYSIRGKTVDGRDLRVVVSFDEDPTMLIVTLIELSD